MPVCVQIAPGPTSCDVGLLYYAALCKCLTQEHHMPLHSFSLVFVWAAVIQAVVISKGNLSAAKCSAVVHPHCVTLQCE